MMMEAAVADNKDLLEKKEKYKKENTTVWFSQ